MSGQDSARGRVDRALTVGGYGRTGTGEPGESTRMAYARDVARFRAWRVRMGLSQVMPPTSEDLASYAADLLESGAAPGTVRAALSAVRWRARKDGHPVPDTVAAWYVLRDGDATRRDDLAVRLPVAGRAELAALLAVCNPEKPGGIRDGSLIAAVWTVGLTPAAAVALDVADARVDADAVELMGDRVPFDGELFDWLMAWRAALDAAGVAAGPLWRAVDRGGNIAGAVPKAGPGRDGHRLERREVARIIRRAMVRAGLPPALAIHPVRALRLGGALAAGDSIVEVEARAGYAPGSVVVAAYRRED